MYKVIKNRLKLNNKQELEQLKEMAHLSKNLYNYTLYNVKQHYLQTSKYMNFFDVYHIVKDNENYKEMPSQVAQQTMKIVDRNFRSFFGLLKKKQKGNYNRQVQAPKYLPKDGHFILIYTPQQFQIKENKIKLTKLFEIPFPKLLNDYKIKEIRILPKRFWFEVQFVYLDDKQYQQIEKNNNWLSIDLGVNNLISMISNTFKKPIIISGKQLKSLNRYFNKEIGKAKSITKKVNNSNTSNRIARLFEKRKNIFSYQFHLISKRIIESCIENNISSIIIGYNKNWKQNINIGKNNNQQFVQLPYGLLISYLEYKGQQHGIEIILQEESYTSKTDALALEEIIEQDTYLGKRLHRGLFQSSTGQNINADINGCLNIVRKCKGDESIIDLVADSGHLNCPLKISPALLENKKTFQESTSFREW